MPAARLLLILQKGTFQFRSIRFVRGLSDVCLSYANALIVFFLRIDLHYTSCITIQLSAATALARLVHSFEHMWGIL